MKKIAKYLGLIIVSLSFSQCASTMKLQEESPITFGEVYSKSWVAGVKGGGSGTNIFIEIKSSEITLDSVFYKGKIAKLEVKPNNKTLFIGRFLSTSNTFNKDGLNSKANKSTTKEDNFPFQLKSDECVVSYEYNGKTNYYKLENIIERQVDALPMSVPPNKN